MATKIRVVALIAAPLVLVAGTFFASACGGGQEGGTPVTGVDGGDGKGGEEGDGEEDGAAGSSSGGPVTQALWEDTVCCYTLENYLAGKCNFTFTLNNYVTDVQQTAGVTYLCAEFDGYALRLTGHTAEDAPGYYSFESYYLAGGGTNSDAAVTTYSYDEAAGVWRTAEVTARYIYMPDEEQTAELLAYENFRYDAATDCYVNSVTLYGGMGGATVGPLPAGCVRLSFGANGSITAEISQNVGGYVAGGTVTVTKAGATKVTLPETAV